MKKLTILLLFALISCAKDQNFVNNNKELSDIPAWVLNPEVEDGVAGIGMASPSMGGIKFQIQVAELDAKGNLAAKINSEISRISKNSLRSANVNSGDDVEEFFAQATKEVVSNLPLTGAVRDKFFFTKNGTLYVRMVLREGDYQKFLDAGERAMLAKAKKSDLGRDNINKAEAATKAIFEELEKERQ